MPSARAPGNGADPVPYALLVARDLTKRFGRVVALEGASLTARAGEVTCLVGDNGAGKSTLIKIIAGVHQPTSGQFFLDGAEVGFRTPRDALDHGIATVHQDLAVVPLMSVWRNFFLGREAARGWGPLRRIQVERCREIARAQLGLVGIEVRGPRPPGGYPLGRGAPGSRDRAGPPRRCPRPDLRRADRRARGASIRARPRARARRSQAGGSRDPGHAQSPPRARGGRPFRGPPPWPGHRGPTTAWALGRRPGRAHGEGGVARVLWGARHRSVASPAAARGHVPPAASWGPGITNARSLIGTQPNLARPQQRPLSSMTPSIVAKDGELVAVVGTPGGRTIINTVAQVILNMIDFEMGIGEAVDAPRIHHQWLPDRIDIEAEGVTSATLEEMGHTVQMGGR